MAIESAADRAIFLSPNDFGDMAVYTPAGGAASDPFAGILDDPSTSLGMSEAGVVSLDARPTFCCVEDDLPPGAEGGDAGDQLAVAGKGTFAVVSIEPDGQGFALLRLGAL